ncbi:MAG: transglycosylase SLT domain-containing protein [Colwellia sp.]|nr:transglycosylase SLT domain-containing protein [Colwellia sp.]
MKISKITLVILLVLSGIVTSAATFANQQRHPPEDDPFAELDQAMAELSYEGSDAEMTEFQQWKDEYLADYQKFRQEYFQKVDDIRDNLISLWGDAEVSSQEELVEYSADKTVKTVLDFEKNEIRISVLHDEDQVVEAKDVIAVLTNQASKDQVLAQLVGEKIDKTLVNDLVKNAKKEESSAQVATNKGAVLNKEIKRIKQQGQAQKNQIEKIIDQLDVDDEKQLVSKAQEQVAQENTEKVIAKQKVQIEKETQRRISVLQAQTAKLESNKAKKEALKSKKITTFTMPLAHKNALTKAKPFIGQVKNQSERWQLSPSLMLAIMHTESYFNPKAQSHVPAYGLMQIVPRTAGVDVNRMLNKKDAPMTEADLFLPNYNITAGVAYMHILNSRYLRKIKDPKSRLYCMIAAYNTGSGNVARTFNIDKSRNINRAAKIINKLTPEQVYDHLVKNLPYDETKHYMKKVVKRQNIYAPVESL